MTEIFAHRGASGYAPENTLEAFRLAMEQGADGMELDVHLTKDGEVVVIHDETLDRTSNGHGNVRDYTLEELKKFSFHNHMEKYQGVQIPTLKEALNLVKNSRIKVNIELKTGIYWYEGIEEKTMDIVKTMGMEDRVIYSSFNHYSIQKVLEQNSDAETAYLFSDVPLNMEKYAKDTGVKGLHPAVYHLKMADFLETYMKSGLKVRVWTVNNKEDMKMFIDAGVDAIITNYPKVSVELRENF
ncbi:glycerophosphodiester phosphodiesterase [Blautia sp. Marseille-P3201T]|uniref:glycerophosphodiester phosphodiesterase n=1 Tax=Blautia sp. Marseille-P3201T TaxID=1907659 RepID=UPI0009313FF4|nr:glycerophosphodiester phosphodiesterase [Blautia sp. Marseille-P3201T]